MTPIETAQAEALRNGSPIAVRLPEMPPGTFFKNVEQTGATAEIAADVSAT